MKKQVNAKDIYDLLIKEDKIFEIRGQIKFALGDVSIVVKQKDVVGNIIQEWLQGWLDSKNIDYAINENTQMPPDFFLNTQDKSKDLLEVKSFNRLASPGFDIADFRMYAEEVIEKPYVLDADYLIFGYEMSDNGDVTVKDLWLKKVWEITRCMDKWALNLQIKRGVVHKIRPGVWYSNKKGIPMFECLADFVSAIEETVYQNPRTHNEASEWKNKFIKSYEKHYGVQIDVPRWSDIVAKYKA